MNFLNNIHPLLRRAKGAPNDTNHAVLNAIDTVLRDAEKFTLDNKVQSDLNTATGTYLEYWGKWFSVFRKEGEDDTSLRQRIVEKINIPRGTNSAIVLAVKRYMENPSLGVRVYEPWRDVFTLNKSELNSLDSLLGEYYNLAVIDVHIGGSFPIEVVEVIKDYKPSGVTLHVTYDPSLASDDGLSGNMITPYTSLKSNQDRMLDIEGGLIKGYSGDIRLSDGITRNGSYVFGLNDSNLNSTNVLTGDYNILHENMHLLATGVQTYAPTDTDTMGTVHQALQPDIEVEDYSKLSSTDGSELTVKLGTSKSLYMTYNLLKQFSAQRISKFTTEVKKVYMKNLDTGETYHLYLSIEGDNLKSTVIPYTGNAYVHPLIYSDKERLFLNTTDKNYLSNIGVIDEVTGEVVRVKLSLEGNRPKLTFDEEDPYTALEGTLANARESLSKLNNLELLISTRENVQGNKLALEAYNFDTNNWDVFSTVVSSHTAKLVVGSINNAQAYLNKNGLLQIRLTTPRDTTVAIDSVLLRYNHYTGIEVNSTFGYSVKGSVTVSYDDGINTFIIYNMNTGNRLEAQLELVNGEPNINILGVAPIVNIDTPVMIVENDMITLDWIALNDAEPLMVKNLDTGQQGTVIFYEDPEGITMEVEYPQ